jgi:DNA-binding transcriptional ArsR family regulator
MNYQPTIIWEKGSAYDLFISLTILHQPEEYGLRPYWAAGVRSRIPMPLRDTLENFQKFIPVPLSFIYDLPEPKNACAVLAALKSLPPEERLLALTFGSKNDENTEVNKQFLLSLEGKQRLTAGIEAEITDHLLSASRATKPAIRALFEAWANRTQFGEDLLAALEAYVTNFFEEEEVRILPAQTRALEEVQALANQKDMTSVLEELSAGVRIETISNVDNLIIAPSFWGAPFVFVDRLSEDTGIIVFGDRPAGTTLVPGDLVPDELLNALKALADPTRLRILRYLVERPLTPSELAKVLRLRPPTVIHHIHNLRLAGLVQVTISPKSERRYALRRHGVNVTIERLQTFLSGD